MFNHKDFCPWQGKSAGLDVESMQPIVHGKAASLGYIRPEHGIHYDQAHMVLNQCQNHVTIFLFAHRKYPTTVRTF